MPRQPNSKIPATFKKINLSYIGQDGDLWAEEMEIPLTVIHNRISIRQAGLHGYNDYLQSIALKDESIF